MWDAESTLLFGQCEGYSLIDSALVSTELGISDLAAQIQSLVDADDFAGAKALYDDSDLQTLALADDVSDADYSTFKSYYSGVAGFHNTFVTACFAGTGVWAGADKIDARVECVLKTTQDSIPLLALLGNLNKAIAEAQAGNTSDAQAALYVDKAYALYKGSEASSNSYSIYGRGQRRGKNFLDASGEALVLGGSTNAILDGTSGVALVNWRIGADFKILQTAVRAGTFNLAAAQAAKQAIASRVVLIYHMCVLRYAFLLDKLVAGGETGTASAFKEQGEGWSFWQAIAPLVAAVAPTGSVAISSLFDLTNTPSGTSNYCETRATMRLAMPEGTRGARDPPCAHERTHSCTAPALPARRPLAASLTRCCPRRRAAPQGLSSTTLASSRVRFMTLRLPCRSASAGATRRSTTCSPRLASTCSPGRSRVSSKVKT